MERTFASAVLFIAGVLFTGYSTTFRWPIWCFILGFMAMGNGAIFTPVALLSWRDDHRARRSRRAH